MADTISAMKSAANESRGQMSESVFRCNRWEINDLQRRLKWIDQEASTTKSNYQHKQKAILMHWTKLFESKKEFKARLNRYNEALKELLQNDDLLALCDSPEEEILEETVERLEDVFKRDQNRASSVFKGEDSPMFQTKGTYPCKFTGHSKGVLVVDCKKQVTDRKSSSAIETCSRSERRGTNESESGRVFGHLVTHMGNPVKDPRFRRSRFEAKPSQVRTFQSREQPLCHNNDDDGDHNNNKNKNKNNNNNNNEENSDRTSGKALFHRSMISEFVDLHKYRQEELLARNAVEKIRNNLAKSHAFYQHRLKMKLPDDPMDLLKRIKADDKARAARKKRSRCRSQLETRTTNVLPTAPRPQTDSALEKTIHLPLLRQSSRSVMSRSVSLQV